MGTDKGADSESHEQFAGSLSTELKTEVQPASDSNEGTAIVPALWLPQELDTSPMC